jgi:hypothetical protein
VTTHTEERAVERSRLLFHQSRFVLCSHHAWPIAFVFACAENIHAVFHGATPRESVEITGNGRWTGILMAGCLEPGRRYQGQTIPVPPAQWFGFVAIALGCRKPFRRTTSQKSSCWFETEATLDEEDQATMYGNLEQCPHSCVQHSIPNY